LRAVSALRVGLPAGRGCLGFIGGGLAALGPVAGRGRVGAVARGEPGRLGLGLGGRPGLGVRAAVAGGLGRAAGLAAAGRLEEAREEAGRTGGLFALGGEDPARRRALEFGPRRLCLNR